MVKTHYKNGGAKGKPQKTHHALKTTLAEEKLEEYANKVKKNKSIINAYKRGEIDELPQRILNALNNTYNISNETELEMALKNVENDIEHIHYDNNVEKAARTVGKIRRETKGKSGKISKGAMKGMKSVANVISNEIREGKRNYKARNKNILNYEPRNKNKNNKNIGSSPTVHQTVLVRSDNQGRFIEISTKSGEEVVRKDINSNSGNVHFTVVEKDKHETHTKTHKDLYNLKKDYFDYIRENTYVDEELFFRKDDKVKTLIEEYPFFYKSNETFQVLTLLQSIYIPENKIKSEDEYLAKPLIQYKKNFRKTLLKQIPYLKKEEIDELADIDDNLDRDQKFRDMYGSVNLEDAILYYQRELAMLKLFFYFENSKENAKLNNTNNLKKLIQHIHDNDQKLYQDLFNFFSNKNKGFSQENLETIQKYFKNNNDSGYIEMYIELRNQLMSGLTRELSNNNTYNNLNDDEEYEMSSDAKDLIRKQLKKLETEYREKAMKKIQNREIKKRIKNNKNININNVEKANKEHEQRLKNIAEKEAKQKEINKAKQIEEAKRKKEQLKKLEEAKLSQNYLTKLKNIEPKKLKEAISKLPKEYKILTELKFKDKKGKNRPITSKEITEKIKQIKNMGELKNFIRSGMTNTHKSDIYKLFLQSLKKELKEDKKINKTFKRFNKLIDEDNQIKAIKKMSNKLNDEIANKMFNAISNNKINQNKIKNILTELYQK